MATVTVFTAERMQEIEDETIIGGSIVGDDLILQPKNGAPINAGDVRGPQGIPGAAEADIVTSVTRPGSPAVGHMIYETDTRRTYIWDGSDWAYTGGIFVCTSGTRPSSPWDGMEIYETDTKRVYIRQGGVWELVSPEIPHSTAAQVTSAAGTTTSATFVNFGVNLAVSNFVKHRDDTKLIAEYAGAVYNDNNLGQLEIGVLIDGTTYVMANGFGNTAQAGFVQVTALPAGTYTCTARRRRVNGVGTVADGGSGAKNNLMITETL